MVYTIAVEARLARELEESLTAGPIIGAAGLRLLNEQQIGRFRGLSVQIYASEHPPPHFHVKCGHESVPFALDTGQRLVGSAGLDRYDRNIANWWRENRCQLILSWNRLRPADCVVGPVTVPPECETEGNEKDE